MGSHFLKKWGVGGHRLSFLLLKAIGRVKSLATISFVFAAVKISVLTRKARSWARSEERMKYSLKWRCKDGPYVVCMGSRRH
jgi:hypothetical protein